LTRKVQDGSPAVKGSKEQFVEKGLVGSSTKTLALKERLSTAHEVGLLFKTRPLHGRVEILEKSSRSSGTKFSPLTGKCHFRREKGARPPSVM